MSWEEELVEALKNNGVNFIAYLPDSALWPLIQLVKSDEWFDVHLVSREEEAIGILSGAWLGGRKGALMCQTSGLANSFNAIAGVSKAWGLPFIGLVTHRGGLGEHNLAHVPAGYSMPRLLDEIGIRNHSLDGLADAKQITEMSIQTAFSTEEPYVILLESTLLDDNS